MSRLDDCLQAAINAGTIDPDLGRRAQAEYRDRVKRITDQGQPPHIAEKMAADEVADSIIRRNKSVRHATLAQLAVLQRNEARYARAHLDDPDLILKDIERANSEARGLERSFMGGIHDALANFKTNIVGQVQNRALLKEVVQELHGQASGNAIAKGIAGAILKQYEIARSLSNALGADVKALHDWGIRHTHHSGKIEEAGFDAWFAKIYDGRLLDWSRIINLKTGKPFAITYGGRPLRADAAVFLKDIYEGIISKGWDDRAPSMLMVKGAEANGRGEERILHFLTADGWMEYNDAFGAENPFEAIISHFRGMARDIALMRAFGPNATMGLTHATQVIEKAAATTTGPDGKALRRMRDLNAAKGRRAKVMMRILTGQANVPHSEYWAAFFAGTRNLLTAAQLGGAPIATVTDWVSMRIAAKAVGLNPNSHTQAMIRQLAGGFSAQQARDMGFIFDTWYDTGASQARFMGDVWAPELTSRITNTVLRANGLAFLTDRSRVAVAAAFGSDLADMAGKGFGDLPKNMQNFMASRAIGAREWDALRDPGAIYTDPTGGKHINHNWFVEHTSLPPAAARDIAIKWGALVQDHMELAIPSASLRGRATLLGDAAPGSFLGELGRSGLMYKSFALSQLFNQMRRVMEMDGGPLSRGLYVAKYMVFMTLAGSLSLQMKEMAKGRDPRPMDTPQFWGAALLQGGGVGIFGDFFSATASRTGGGIAEVLAGPVAGIAGDIGRAVSSNAQRMAEGKDILLGRDVANLARRYNPLATFQPPIPVPTRLAMDRLIWDQLQLFLDPEAEDLFRRAEKKQRGDFGNASWWQRGQTAPARGPDFANIAGGAP